MKSDGMVGAPTRSAAMTDADIFHIMYMSRY